MKTKYKPSAWIYPYVMAVTEELAKTVRDIPEGENPGHITGNFEIDTNTFDFGNSNMDEADDIDKVQYIIEEIHRDFMQVAHGSNEVRQHFVLFPMEEEVTDEIRPFITAIQERMKELGIGRAVVWLGE